MIPFKIEGKKYSLPNYWADVTVKQFKELKAYDGEDYVKFLSIITGVEYSTLYNTKQIDIIDKVEPFLQFLKTPFGDKDKVTTITIDQKVYDVPKDLTQYTLAQKIAAWNAYSKAITETKDPYNALSFVVAVYLQPIVTGKEYSSDAAHAFAKDVIDKLSIIPVYSIGSFFLNAYVQSNQKKQLPLALSRIKNSRLREWVSSMYLKRLTRSMPLPAEIS